MRGRATPALRNGFARGRPRASDQQRWRHLGDVVVQARRGRQPNGDGGPGLAADPQAGDPGIDVVAGGLAYSRERRERS